KAQYAAPYVRALCSRAFRVPAHAVAVVGSRLEVRRQLANERMGTHRAFVNVLWIMNLQPKGLPRQAVFLIQARSAASKAPRQDSAFPPRRNGRSDSSRAALRFHGRQRHCNVCNATVGRRLPISEQTDDP